MLVINFFHTQCIRSKWFDLVEAWNPRKLLRLPNMCTKRRFIVAILTLFVLLLAYLACFQLLLCHGNDCYLKQPSIRILLAGRFVYPIEHVESSVNNVYFSIKTTAKNELSRLQIILFTWLQTIPGQNVSILHDVRSIYILRYECWKQLSTDRHSHRKTMDKTRVVYMMCVVHTEV